MCYPLPWFPLSDDPSRCIRHTTTDCLSYRSSLSEYRFGRSGSSEFVGGFHLLHWSSCVPLPRVRSCRFALSPALSHERRSRCWDEKSSSNTSLIYINPNNCLNCSIPSTLPKNKEKAKKSFPIFCLLNFLTP